MQIYHVFMGPFIARSDVRNSVTTIGIKACFHYGCALRCVA